MKELSAAIYAELEAIVGKENISNDPCVLQTYRCQAAHSSAHYGPYDHLTPTPRAVLLPGSTKEVQDIILACNRHGLKYKASGTFWAAHGYIGSDYAIQLDMRRMDKIEIDPLNMIAIIEPYVCGAALQAETMKHSLTCNIPGCGASCTVLGNAAGWAGSGPMSIYTGNAYECILSMEWVLPNGEIIVTGSAGSGCGWFSGDGPGPSSRAILRSAMGTAGEMGVCTHMAVKLSPWHGPAVLDSYGDAPFYRAKLPENFRAYAIGFPTWKDWADANVLLWHTGINIIGHRQFSMFGRDIKGQMLNILTDPDKQLCDLPELMQDEEMINTNESLHREVYVVLAGTSEKDMLWKEKTLEKILEQTHGWKDKFMLDPEREKWLLLYLIRMGHKNLNFVLCGAYEGHFGFGGGNPYLAGEYLEEAMALKKEWEQKDDFLAAVGGDAALTNPSSWGGGGMQGWETFACYDPHDKVSIKKTCDYFTNVSDRWMKSKGFGGCFGKSNESCRKSDGYEYTQEEHNQMFSKMPDTTPYIYQWKVREAVNPNHLGSSYYATLDPNYKG